MGGPRRSGRYDRKNGVPGDPGGPGGPQPPVEAREWLARSTGRGVRVEDLCPLARQAVERALQAVLVSGGLAMPSGSGALSPSPLWSRPAPRSRNGSLGLPTSSVPRRRRDQFGSKSTTRRSWLPPRRSGSPRTGSDNDRFSPCYLSRCRDSPLGTDRIGGPHRNGRGSGIAGGSGQVVPESADRQNRSD